MGTLSRGEPCVICSALASTGLVCVRVVPRCGLMTLTTGRKKGLIRSTARNSSRVAFRIVFYKARVFIDLAYNVSFV